MWSLFFVSVRKGLSYEHIRMDSNLKYCLSSVVEIGLVVLEKKMKWEKEGQKKTSTNLTRTYSGLQLKWDKIKSHIDFYYQITNKYESIIKCWLNQIYIFTSNHYTNIQNWTILYWYYSSILLQVSCFD